MKLLPTIMDLGPAKFTNGEERLIQRVRQHAFYNVLFCLNVSPFHSDFLLKMRNKCFSTLRLHNYDPKSKMYKCDTFPSEIFIAINMPKFDQIFKHFINDGSVKEPCLGENLTHRKGHKTLLGLCAILWEVMWYLVSYSARQLASWLVWLWGKGWRL